jgi:hypothetical protein
MRAAVLAKGSALASRQRSRYSRRGAMPLAVKKRRERHQGAWPRTDNAAHRPERGERSLENEIMVWTATSTNFNPTVVPFGSESSTNHLVSQQQRIRRREAHRVGPARAGRLRNDGFFHTPFLIGCPRDFASTGLASAASAAKAEGLWLAAAGSPRRGSEYG